MSRPLALAHLCALDASPPLLLRAAAAAGFEAVSLRLRPASRRERVFPLTPGSRLLAETQRTLAAHPIAVLEVEVLVLQESTVVAELEPMLELAAALGAPHLLVAARDPDPGRVTANYRSVCELAAGYGVRPVLEFIPFTPVSTLEGALEVIRAADHPGGAVLVDVLHLWRSGGTPDGLARAVRRAPRLFPYAQLCDTPLHPPPGGDRALYREAVEDRLLPGDGELPLQELVRALPVAAPLSVEAPSAALAGHPVADRVSLIAERTRTFLAGGR